MVIMVMPAISHTQDVPQDATRTVERFSFSFEASEAVEIELTTNKPVEEIENDEFLTLQFFDRKRLVLTAEFNLSQLPLISIVASPTGYGKAVLSVNGLRSELVPLRRDRIYLQARAFVSTLGRDYETDELVLVPSDTSLRGLMTFVNRDGGRRTQTVVTTSMKIRVSE